MKKRTENVNVRVDASEKGVLQQIANKEGLDLSDIARRAFALLIAQALAPKLTDGNGK